MPPASTSKSPVQVACSRLRLAVLSEATRTLPSSSLLSTSMLAVEAACTWIKTPSAPTRVERLRMATSAFTPPSRRIAAPVRPSTREPSSTRRGSPTLSISRMMRTPLLWPLIWLLVAMAAPPRRLIPRLPIPLPVTVELARERVLAPVT
ncbi:hypothetical protein D3C84_955210 [compost metagenome]